MDNGYMSDQVQWRQYIHLVPKMVNSPQKTDMPHDTNCNSPKLRPHLKLKKWVYSLCANSLFNAAELFFLMRTTLQQYSPRTASNIMQPSDTGTAHFSPQTALTIVHSSDTGTPYEINHNSPITIMWSHHFINVSIQIDRFTHFWYAH